MAGVMPRRTETGRELYGYVTIAVSAGASAALELADGLARLVGECEAVFARADAPNWGTDAANPDAFGTVDLPVAPGWILSERVGWMTFLPSSVTASPQAMQALAVLGVASAQVERGQILKLSPRPIQDSDPADIDLYRAARKILGGCLGRR
jgi:hypothetical protein